MSFSLLKELVGGMGALAFAQLVGISMERMVGVRTTRQHQGAYDNFLRDITAPWER